MRPSPLSVSGTFHLPKLRLCPHQTAVPPPPAPGTLSSTFRLYDSMTLGTSSQEWNHTHYVSLRVWLISLCIMSPNVIHVVSHPRVRLEGRDPWFIPGPPVEPSSEPYTQHIPKILSSFPQSRGQVGKVGRWLVTGKRLSCVHPCPLNSFRGLWPPFPERGHTTKDLSSFRSEAPPALSVPCEMGP